MHAVFEHTWQLLNDPEREVFQRLSVFRGGFRREAAQSVAGVTLSVLVILLDKSLLRQEADGRYYIHELLRQYAAEKLACSSSEDVTNLQDLHCTYYLTFLMDHKAGIIGGRQLETADEIAAEFDNVRRAWQWAIAQEKVPEIAGAAFSLYYFYQFNSRYLEGAQMFSQAAQILDDDILLAKPEALSILTCLGWFHVRLGHFEQARNVFERCHTMYGRLDQPPEMSYAIDPSLGLGLLASIRGDYEETERLLKRMVRTSEQHGYLLNQEAAHYLLTGNFLAQGQYELAQRHARAAYAASQALQDRWFMAYS